MMIMQAVQAKNERIRLPIRWVLMSCLAVLAVVGCAGKPTNPTGLKQPSSSIKVPNRYQVKAGDTVSSISRRYGLNWREVSAMNKLDSNHTIYVGQWLTLPQSNISKATFTSSRATGDKVAVAQPKAQKEAVVSPPRYTAQVPITSTQIHNPTQAYNPAQVSIATSGKLVDSSAIMSFAYPVGHSNPPVRHFGERIAGANEPIKGMFFAGQAGDGIFASESGKVVYKNKPNERPVIVLEHSNGYTTNYFDMANILVKEGQLVKKGDKLGVMAPQFANGQALFEFRVAKNMQYIDPVSVLR